jgi:hypothetical protein
LAFNCSAAFGLAAQLLVGQLALAALLGAVRDGDSLGAVVPWALAVGAISVVLFFSSALRPRRSGAAPTSRTQRIAGIER